MVIYGNLKCGCSWAQYPHSKELFLEKYNVVALFVMPENSKQCECLLFGVH